MSKKCDESYQCFCERHCKCDYLPAPTVNKQAKGAVVSILTQTTTTDSGNPLVTEIGTGFYVDKEHIVTSAHNVIYNNENQDRSPPVGGTNYLLARVRYIWITLARVNCCCDSYIYQADLVGLSPSLDIAVLKLSKCQDSCAPELCKHAHPICWAKPRKYAAGEPAYVVAHTEVTGAIGISQGIVSDNSAGDALLSSSDPEGFWPFEGVLADTQVVPGNSGGPLLDGYGHALGVISGTYNYSEDCSATLAVSAKIAKYVINALICNGKPRCERTLACKQIVTVPDSTGPFYYYRYGWLGILGFFAFNARVFDYVPDTKYCRYRGFIITALDVDGPLFPVFSNIYVNFDDINPPAPTPDNEIYLITSLKGECDKRKTPMGVMPGTYPFTAVTARLNPCCKVYINYRLGSEKFCQCHQICVTLGVFPDNTDLVPPESLTVSSIRSLGPSMPSFASRDAILSRKTSTSRALNGELALSRSESPLNSLGFLSPDQIGNLMKLMSVAPTLLSLFSQGANGLSDIIEKYVPAKDESAEKGKEEVQDFQSNPENSKVSADVEAV